MKNLSRSIINFTTMALLACVLVTVCGCAATHERGWIGGEYRVVNSFPDAMNPRPRAGLLLVALSTNTPVYVAGLLEGDVVLKVDHKPIRHLLNFRRQIDASEPGKSLPISAWHDGKTMDCDVIVGRETFRYADTFDLLVLPTVTGEWNFWPTSEYPGISLLLLGYKSESARRAELGSVNNSYLRQINPDYEVQDTNWRCWLVVSQFTRNEEILTQEEVSK